MSNVVRCNELRRFQVRRSAKVIAFDVSFATRVSAACPGSSRWFREWLRRAGNVCSLAACRPGTSVKVPSRSSPKVRTPSRSAGHQPTGWSPLVPVPASFSALPKSLYGRRFDQRRPDPAARLADASHSAISLLDCRRSMVGAAPMPDFGCHSSQCECDSAHAEVAAPRSAELRKSAADLRGPS